VFAYPSEIKAWLAARENRFLLVPPVTYSAEDNDELIALCVQARRRAKAASENLELVFARQSTHITTLITNVTRLLQDLSSNLSAKRLLNDCT